MIINPDEGERYARSCETCFTSVFLVPQSLTLGDDERRSGAGLPLLHNRPCDDLDLTIHEQRHKQPSGTHHHRQSLPLELDVKAATELRRLSTNHRTSLLSATTMEEEVVPVVEGVSNTLVEPAQGILEEAVPLEVLGTKAGKQLSRLLQSSK